LVSSVRVCVVCVSMFSGADRETEAQLRRGDSVGRYLRLASRRWHVFGRWRAVAGHCRTAQPPGPPWAAPLTPFTPCVGSRSPTACDNRLPTLVRVSRNIETQRTQRTLGRTEEIVPGGCPSECRADHPSECLANHSRESQAGRRRGSPMGDQADTGSRSRTSAAYSSRKARAGSILTMRRAGT
jgi:hypothetical protein